MSTSSKELFYHYQVIIHTTSEILKSVSAIHKIAESIYNVHKAETADNTALKLLERKQKEALKAQNNIIKAIEQGIITEATKTRLTELEKQLTSLEFEIAKEKARCYTYLTVEQIEMYLSKFVFENTDDKSAKTNSKCLCSGSYTL